MLSQGAAFSDRCAAAVGDVEIAWDCRYVVYCFFCLIYPVLLSFEPLVSLSAFNRVYTLVIPICVAYMKDC